MPGFPIGNLSDADALNSQINQQAAIPSRVQQAVFDDLKRMPLHHIAAANRYNGASPAFPVNLADNQASAQFASSDDKPLTINRDPAHNFASQFVPGIHGSADSEHDLAAMVHDFMENGSYGSDIPDSSDGENSLPNCPWLFETLQALKFNVTSIEKELLSVLSIFFPSMKDIDLFCLKTGAECKGACIRRMLVKHLRPLGYDAAICSSKWSNSGKVPGDIFPSNLVEEQPLHNLTGTIEAMHASIGEMVLSHMPSYLSQSRISFFSHSYMWPQVGMVCLGSLNSFHGFPFSSTSMWSQVGMVCLGSLNSFHVLLFQV